MKRRKHSLPIVRIVFGVLILLLILLLQSCRTSDGQDLKGRPNIIVILVDDMGFSDIGCYGSEIATPNIDKLGVNGLRFTQFYNASRCCPSRASLLTGLYPHQVGMGGMVDTHGRTRKQGPYQGWLSQNSVTIAEVLQEKGYNTYMSGKWHIGEDSQDWPVKRGFNKYFGLISGACSYFEILPGRKIVDQNTVCTSLPEGFYMTHAITDSALSFTKQGVKEGKPFFLYLAYTAPHWPIHAVEDKIQKYRGKYLKGWDSIRQERHQKQIDIGLFANPVDLSPRDKAVPAWDTVTNKDEWDLKMSVYAAMIESVDDGVGKIVSYLKETGQLENTVIVFLSDNGACHESLERRLENDLQEFASIARTIPPGSKGSYTDYGKQWANASNTPFRLYKHWTHEGGISTPFIIHYPKLVKKGKIVHEVSHLIDIMPTILDLSGATYPTYYNGFKIRSHEGISMLPILKDEKWQGHEYLFWEHEESRAVRQGKWKLVSMPKAHWELYDMDSDRSELKDISKSFPEQVKSMEAQYKSWAAEVGVKKQ